MLTHDFSPERYPAFVISLPGGFGECCRHRNPVILFGPLKRLPKLVNSFISKHFLRAHKRSPAKQALREGEWERA